MLAVGICRGAMLFALIAVKLKKDKTALSSPPPFESLSSIGLKQTVTTDVVFLVFEVASFSPFPMHGWGFKVRYYRYHTWYTSRYSTGMYVHIPHR
jgi:hypothetical protein